MCDFNAAFHGAVTPLCGDLVRLTAQKRGNLDPFLI